MASSPCSTGRRLSPRKGVGPRQQLRRFSFFLGTKLPISLKTKGRGGQNRGTKLPFARALSAEITSIDLMLSTSSGGALFFRNKATDLVENKGSGWTKKETKLPFARALSAEIKSIDLMLSTSSRCSFFFGSMHFTQP